VLLTIAIPTFNRLRQLRRALRAIDQLVVPENVELVVAISNTASGDGTFRYLERVESLRSDYKVINQSRGRTIMTPNWVVLSYVVPRNSDWVWFHGDDDEILDPEALVKIFDLIKKYDSLSPHLVSLTQANRAIGPERAFTGTLFEIADTFGYHEVLGWMSQLFMRGKVYFQMMDDYATSHHNNNSPERLNARCVGNFPHSAALLEMNFKKTAIFFHSRLIDEQVPPLEKKVYVRKRKDLELERRDFNFTDRFFYDADWISKILENRGMRGSVNFFRYVNKSFWDLLISIILSELRLVDPKTRLSLGEKINSLQRLVLRIECPEKRSGLNSVLCKLKDASATDSHTLRADAVEDIERIWGHDVYDRAVLI
jgi:glycosyltransferase involved in cell wall biosynthesis